MDDYILETLRKQEDHNARDNGDEVRKAMEREAVLAGRMEGTSFGAEDYFEETSAERNHETVSKSMRQDTIQTVLRRMDVVTLPTKSPVSAEMAQGMGLERNARTMTLSAGPEFRERAAVEPEALSMFFQRDARRYS